MGALRPCSVDLGDHLVFVAGVTGATAGESACLGLGLEISEMDPDSCPVISEVNGTRAVKGRGLFSLQQGWETSFLPTFI